MLPSLMLWRLGSRCCYTPTSFVDQMARRSESLLPPCSLLVIDDVSVAAVLSILCPHSSLVPLSQQRHELVLHATIVDAICPHPSRSRWFNGLSHCFCPAHYSSSTICQRSQPLPSAPITQWSVSAVDVAIRPPPSTSKWLDGLRHSFRPTYCSSSTICQYGLCFYLHSELRNRCYLAVRALDNVCSDVNDIRDKSCFVSCPFHRIGNGLRWVFQVAF
ncbi:hypothetical protein BDQ17DRAFT_1367902 [Cyathus striatus]|nr:hypothetical protein BDQ17DRAFT_1367902 [Cyathus striatus]